ncbi:hypothetical protein ABR737_00190 [Streptomyces sp. Edi2]|uniref:hypothetical protein n=1 Tax=Streptomyces sp. Edi2 TaxID=3162528 RepID=UPI003305D15E
MATTPIDGLAARIVRNDLASRRATLARDAKQVADIYTRLAAALEDEHQAITAVGGDSSRAAAGAQQLAQQLARLIGMSEIANITLDTTEISDRVTDQ